MDPEAKRGQDGGRKEGGVIVALRFKIPAGRLGRRLCPDPTRPTAAYSAPEDLGLQELTERSQRRVAVRRHPR